MEAEFEASLVTTEQLHGLSQNSWRGVISVFHDDGERFQLLLWELYITVRL
jgi:hypothetical protein